VSDARSVPRQGAVLALMSAIQFMVILDLAVVNVAIPSIQADLDVSQADLQWVIVTYGVTLGGFLLLGGRAADLVGRRPMLVGGLALFTVASLTAGLSQSLAQLVVSRGVQGIGAAMAAPAALSVVVNTFAEGPSRTKALGIFAAVSSSAGSIGVIASGVLTDGAGWEWIFLINVPIGVVLVAAVLRTIPQPRPADRGATDALGAATVTAGLMAIVYAINQSIEHGWTSAEVVGFLAVGVVLLAAFVVVERRAASPVLPLSMFRRRTLTTATIVAALVFAAFFATIFQATLFMQQGLGYSAIDTGLAWLASTLSSLVVAGALAPRMVDRFGASRSLVVGQIIQAAGLLSLARVPDDADYWVDLFPGFLAFGVGLGFSVMAIQVAAFIGVEERMAGLAGGIVETSREVGGALGTAIVATLAIASTNGAAAGGATPVGALTEGFRRGELVAALLSVAAAAAAGLLLRPAERRTHQGRPPGTGAEATDVVGEPVALVTAASESDEFSTLAGS
jgi:EmrB/QacA subfamily drug resistance transporter